MSRGGKRPGAGRKRKEGERVAIRLDLPKDAAEILKEKAAERQQTRTEFLAKMLRDFLK